MEKELKLELEKKQIETGASLKGTAEISYVGRFDSLVINSQIENTSDHFIYINLNGKTINHPYARLSLMKQEIPDTGKIEFTITTIHIPANFVSHAKVRVSLIQEHKEIASDIANFKIMKNANSR